MSRDLGRVERLAKRIATAQANAVQPQLPGLVQLWRVYPSGAGEDEVRIAYSQRDALMMARLVLDTCQVGEPVCIVRAIDGEDLA